VLHARQRAQLVDVDFFPFAAIAHVCAEVGRDGSDPDKGRIRVLPTPRDCCPSVSRHISRNLSCDYMRRGLYKRTWDACTCAAASSRVGHNGTSFVSLTEAPKHLHTSVMAVIIVSSVDTKVAYEHTLAVLVSYRSLLAFRLQSDAACYDARGYTFLAPELECISPPHIPTSHSLTGSSDLLASGLRWFGGFCRCCELLGADANRHLLA